MKQVYNPTEAQVRDHFGDYLPSVLVIERVPHTLIWATTDGLLLWSKSEGFNSKYKVRAWFKED